MGTLKDTPVDLEPLASVQLPRSLRLAGEMVGLEAFLADAALGFHWDLLDRMEEGVYFVDHTRRVMYWSAGATRISGYEPEEVLGRRCADNILCHVNHRGACLCENGCPLAAVLCDGENRAMEVFLHHKDGHRVPVRVYAAPIRNASGEIIGAFETFSDATARAGDLDRIADLEQLAYLDELTQMPNRRFLERSLASRLGELEREGLSFGFLLLDIDHFKRFNDTYGHDVGDRVLKMVGRTLVNACRQYDLAARWGGEEFAVLAGHGDEEAVRSLAERLRSLVAESHLTHEQGRLSVTVSVGATAARRGDDAASLFNCADDLLYESKQAGRNRVRFAA
jgi:diguanylate cyclase (GGDEF)-like protein/PAS domain S-box-containing protein